jgi:glycosyltransferase involved in cell wall biosynthesis
MRVHALIDSLTWGGAETLLADFAAGAASAGIELSVGYLQPRSGDPAAARLRAAGIEPQLVGISSLLHPRDMRRVRRQLQRVRPDILHTHLGYADLLGGVAARSLGIPAVSTIHVTQWETGAREVVKERLMSFARRGCSARTIAVSDFARERLLAGGWDRPERTVTIHNGIAPPAVARTRDEVRRELGLDPGDVAIAMVGVLRPGKGQLEAIAAMEGVGDRARLLIAGDGPERAAVAAAAAPLGNRAVMLGWRDDVADLLGAADVMLLPSHAEAFPTVLLEAMAARLPIVATRVGGIPEIVDDGATGVLVAAPPHPPAVTDALRPLVADAERRAEIGARGRDAFERRFTAERWAARLRELYDEVVRSATASTMRRATRSQVKRSTSRS